MNWMSRLKIMPLLVLVAALSFGVRFGEFVTGVSSLPGTAQAQQVADPEDEANTDESAGEVPEMSAPPSPPSLSGDETPRTTPVNVSEAVEQSPEWKDSMDSEIEFSEVRMELFEDLAARRKDLQSQERELAVREALLKAAEQEINQKYKELISLRSEIQDLLVEQSSEEQKRITSLVKIYEGMKPKDAARIFNTLDLDVLLQVVSQMSERKSAPVIASMNPDRARTLTIMLMEQKSLPSLADDGTS